MVFVPKCDTGENERHPYTCSGHWLHWTTHARTHACRHMFTWEWRVRASVVQGGFFSEYRWGRTPMQFCGMKVKRPADAAKILILSTNAAWEHKFELYLALMRYAGTNKIRVIMPNETRDSKYAINHAFWNYVMMSFHRRGNASLREAPAFRAGRLSAYACAIDLLERDVT